MAEAVSAAVTNAFPENPVGGILANALRLLTFFNEYEALKMLEILQNKAADAKRDEKNVLPARLPNGQGEGRDLQEPIQEPCHAFVGG